MKLLKTIFLCLLSFAFCLGGCTHTKTQGLSEYLSELRTATYFGQEQDFVVKAYYGFKETPYNNDAVSQKRVFNLTFFLPQERDFNAQIQLCFTYNNVEYNKVFEHNPTSDRLETQIQIDSFDQKEFCIKISKSSKSVDVQMKSIVPQNALSYQDALACLIKSQQQLINNYYDQNGKFCAEIRMRILVKDQKPFWYVGFYTANDGVKALLIDGIDGKVLAIREVF